MAYPSVIRRRRATKRCDAFQPSPEGGGATRFARGSGGGSKMGARPSRPRLAILCSGAGTNLQAILTAIRRGRLRAQVVLVAGDRADAPALRRARRAGVPTTVVASAAYPSRAAYDAALTRLLRRHRVEWVILAGFMRILTPGFVRRFAGRILNVHPALLPAFRGAHAVRDALAYGVTVTGVTIHLVDAQVDHGPIVAQQAVPVRPGDTEAALLARVHRVEHQLYPQAIQWAVSGRLRVRGRRVIR